MKKRTKKKTKRREEKRREEKKMEGRRWRRSARPGSGYKSYASDASVNATAKQKRNAAQASGGEEQTQRSSTTQAGN